ncbi:hypothetical protein J6590_033486 [Homalodisca vitripennis]|nr:hypothetical protein J6590_033486 [Homalodisca vitripennis]
MAIGYEVLRGSFYTSVVDGCGRVADVAVNNVPSLPRELTPSPVLTTARKTKTNYEVNRDETR